MKSLIARLPGSVQQLMKRRMFARQLRKGDFGAASSDLDEATRNLSDGDWVIDVGANVGHYTRRFSDSVGPSGRVIAVEPVPETFELLASNAALFEKPQCHPVRDGSFG